MENGLFPYESQVLNAVKQAFALESELVIHFARSLKDLRRIFEQVAIGGEDEFRAGRVVVMGFVNHTHHLLLGGLQSLQAGNGPVWSACVRGLIETFGACVLISERPQTTPNYLQHVRAGQLRAAAERGRAGLGGDIDRLNQIVHPVSGAIYAAFKAISGEDENAHIAFGLHSPTADEGREGVVVLATWPR